MSYLRHLRRAWYLLIAHLSQPVASHPRGHIHAQRNAGEVVADAVVSGMGSWTFIIAQTCIVLLWVTCNLIGWGLHWDAYPFILLNLVFSTQAAYASPLILMAGNRSAAKDRMRDDQEAAEVETMAAQSQAIYDLNQQQLVILQQQSEILDALHALSSKDSAA